MTAWQNFWREYKAATEQNPVQQRERIWQGRVAFSFSIYVPALNIARLQSVRSLRRGEGYASAALDWLTALATKYNMTIVGWVEPCGDRRPRLNTKQLTAWYRRHGFTVRRNGQLCFRRTKNADEL